MSSRIHGCLPNRALHGAAHPWDMNALPADTASDRKSGILTPSSSRRSCSSKQRIERRKIAPRRSIIRAR
eukprot:3325507-Pyramimonas_sp.AAC.1